MSGPVHNIPRDRRGPAADPSRSRARGARPAATSELATSAVRSSICASPRAMLSSADPRSSPSTSARNPRCPKLTPSTGTWRTIASWRARRIVPSPPRAITSPTASGSSSARSVVPRSMVRSPCAPAQASTTSSCGPQSPEGFASTPTVALRSTVSADIAQAWSQAARSFPAPAREQGTPGGRPGHRRARRGGQTASLALRRGRRWAADRSAARLPGVPSTCCMAAERAVLIPHEHPCNQRFLGPGVLRRVPGLHREITGVGHRMGTRARYPLVGGLEAATGRVALRAWLALGVCTYPSARIAG
jgi:hypothetical protein